MGIESVLTGREHDLGGGFVVRRLLPAQARRAVGPFVFFDHFGPVQARPEDNHDVRPHPHIGLATVTYLFEGAMTHRDSLGTVQRIEPGALNWMTAGRGIVHSERTPEDLRGRTRLTHGLQLWAALPGEQEEAAPAFAHTPADRIPEIMQPGVRVRVLIGEALDRRSPVATASETLYLDIALEAGARLPLPPLTEEQALYAVDGTVEVDGEALTSQRMALLDPAASVMLAARAPARCVLIGGAPLGERFMWWNFVASSKRRIVQAADDWAAGRFPPVPGETEFIPLPDKRPALD